MSDVVPLNQTRKPKLTTVGESSSPKNTFRSPEIYDDYEWLNQTKAVDVLKKRTLAVSDASETSLTSDLIDHVLQNLPPIPIVTRQGAFAGCISGSKLSKWFWGVVRKLVEQPLTVNDLTEMTVQIKELIAPYNAPSISPSTSLRATLRLLAHRGSTFLPVEKNTEFLGLITSDEIVKALCRRGS